MSQTPLANIVSIFVREANQRIAVMTHALDALDADASDTTALQELMRRFHSFAGVGGLDGFEVINSLGARGESDCRRVLDAGNTPSAEQLRRWRSVVDIMKGEVEEMMRGVASLPEHSAAVPPSRRVYDVLLVEDDPEVRTLLSERLFAEGFNVNVAETRTEAMECLMVQRPHALIVDISLPDGSGYDVIERLRAVQGPENVAVLIISRLGAFHDRVDGIRCGADGYFAKPLDYDRVVRRLRALVQSRDETVARILSVEDDPDQAAYLRAVLEHAGYDVRTCSDPRNFESDMTSFAPDLILMDILLPGVSGYELARYARQIEECQTTPILFLSTEGQLHTRIQSMRSGGDDHIVKPVAPNLLLAAVETRIDRARQIRQFLDRDNLTGLLNRSAFLRRVQSHIRRGESAPAALVMLDVDCFKTINDSHGHAFGDHVLSRLGTFLRTHVRATDSVCRYGGEEFTMLIDDVTEEEAMRLLDRLREEFASVAHVTPLGKTIYATFSAGVTSLPKQVSAMPRSIEAADAAMYRAKAEGRNRVCGAMPPFPTRISA
ncbi:MAG TPA: response regulator [Thermoanaerobaculia bacterium]|nr:response regulator [Thermoanaerobaculia bacterium]